jgi:hypothetical protein
LIVGRRALQKLVLPNGLRGEITMAQCFFFLLDKLLQEFYIKKKPSYYYYKGKKRLPFSLSIVGTHLYVVTRVN